MGRRFTYAGLLALALVSAATGAAANGQASARAVCPGPPIDTVRCHARVVTDARGNPLATTGPTGYGPTQFRTAYGLPALAPVPATIAVVDAYDDPKAEADLGTYSAAYKLPACTTANGCFRKVDQTGGTSYPKADPGWALEISLDIQVAHGLCPNCKLLLVVSKTAGFRDMLAAHDYAATHATVVSDSWGTAEFAGETVYDSHFNRSGVPTAASSGDSGYGVEYPAASPYVTAVGGTTLKLTLSNTRASETTWSGAGSGCSAYEAKSSWQRDAGCAKRSVADVAADADPSTGASVYDSYGYQSQSGWFTVGGTSLAAPIIAAVYALAGNASSTAFGSYPYSHARSFYDVLSGSNGACSLAYLCTAGVGYDGPTGLGAPIGTAGF
jgi:subtilase family serine protease